MENQIQDETPSNLDENVSVEEKSAENAMQVDNTLEEAEAPAAEVETPQVEENTATEVEETSEEGKNESSSEETVEAPVVEEVAEEPAAEAPVAEAAVEAKSDDEKSEEGSEEEAPVSAVQEDIAAEEAAKAAAAQLVKDVIEKEEEFDKLVAKATPIELALLLERFYDVDTLRPLIPKVGMIKRTFDKIKQENAEDIDAAVLGRFNMALARFNRKRGDWERSQESNKAQNSVIKRDLLDQLRKIVEEEKVTAINEVRDIQQKWRDTGYIKQDDVFGFSQEYKRYLDVFYNLRSHYRELLEMDRKHNLEEKKKVIAKIEALIPTEGDVSREGWKERSEKIQALQEAWKTLGPVPREEDEANFEKYKKTLDEFYGLRSKYYESQDDERKENAEKKQVILEKLKTYTEFSSERAKDWNGKTKEILAIQEEWKGIGPAPTSVNKDLWKEYRSICDKFFSNKSVFFKQFDAQRAENYKKKLEIIEKAEAVKDNEDWRATAEVLKQFQNDWKAIGPVSDRHSNKIWKRFRAACDHFFRQKK